ncbi:MAG: SRPBCC domain-containing protein [Patescibacteria group bacterium]|nr:SRPBCC domain-containing protein [Patescibacteria group bacterium]
MDDAKLFVDREKLEIKMERVFDAPRELLWKAHTDPNLIPQWWGPRNTTTAVEKMDVRNGGEWKFVHDKKDVFYGIFKEIKEPEFITWTFNYEPIGPGHESVETIRFEETEENLEQSRRTRVSTLSHFNSLEDLDGMVNSGMEKGARETWDRLAELLEKMKKGEM